jgi:hypothetical protein
VQKRSLLMLLAATVLAVAMAAYTAAQRDRSAGSIEQERPAFPQLAARLDDLAWIRLTRGRHSIDFAMVDGKWTVVEKGNYPAAVGRVGAVLRGLAGLRLIEPKTRRRALFARLGLADPPGGTGTFVGLQDRMGETVAALVVGRTDARGLASGNGVYVRRPGEEQTWLARGRLDLGGDVSDWLDRRILDIPSSRIAGVTLTVDGAAMLLRRGRPTDPFVITGSPSDTQGRASAMLAAPAALRDLELTDVKPAADMPVPATGIATASFATFDGLTITTRAFQAGGADWLALDAAGSRAAAGEAASLHARLTRWVFAVPPERARLLRTAAAALLPVGKGVWLSR